MARKLLVFFLLLPVFLSTNATAATNSSKVTVFAASSLTESFTELGKRFQRAHPGVKIIFSFQASSTLATQIKAGAPADIFVSAAVDDMSNVAKGKDYLVNRVVLATNRDSKIEKFTDLNGSVIWIQCAPEVPCGSAASQALKQEAVTSKPASLEPKATSAVAKLLAGEVDAAIIYRTDVIANKDKLKAIEFKDRKGASTTYQIAQLRRNHWASTFMRYLNSRVTMEYLVSKGFERP